MSSESFQSALDRAKARAANDYYEVRRTFYDEEFVLTFAPRATPDAIEIIGKLGSQDEIAALAAGSIDAKALDDLMKAIAEFLDAQATGDTAEMIAALMRERVIGIAELLEIQREVIERVAGRPTTSAPSSSDGSSTAGASSTDGALPAPSTPAV